MRGREKEKAPLPEWHMMCFGKDAFGDDSVVLFC